MACAAEGNGYAERRRGSPWCRPTSPRTWRDPSKMLRGHLQRAVRVSIILTLEGVGLVSDLRARTMEISPWFPRGSAGRTRRSRGSKGRSVAGN
jgi:hypothetical protein